MHRTYCDIEYRSQSQQDEEELWFGDDNVGAEEFLRVRPSLKDFDRFDSSSESWLVLTSTDYPSPL
jgi:hypothetical protein